MLDRRREMLSLHKQGMKVCEWAPLVASKYNTTEDVVKRDWSRRRGWMHHFFKLDDPIAMAKKLISDNEVLLLDAHNLYEQAIEPKIQLQIMWLRLKINREKINLLKEIGEYSSINELKQAIYKDLEDRKRLDAEIRLERELIDKIEKETKFDLPETIVQKRLQRMVQDAIDAMIKQGFTKEEALKKEEEFRTKFFDEALRQVKVAFILDKIAELENINTEESDVEDRFKRVSQQTRQPVEKIREYYIDNKLIDSLHAELRNQKVIHFIKENAEIK